MTSFYPQDKLAARARTLEAVGLDRPVPDVRRTPDGLVDMDYYLARGRDERAKAARQILAAVGRLVAAAFHASLVRARKPHRIDRDRPHYV